MKKLIALVLVAAGCSPVYVPNVRNAPLFRDAGEFQGSLHVGNGIDVQGAVSVTKHLGLMANYTYTSRTSSEDDYLRHNFFEGGIGYFENSGKICYEVFGGYGKGEGTNYDEYDFINPGTIEATGKYDRYFLQPSIGSNSRTFNWIVSARFSFVDFTEFESDGVVYPQREDPYLFIEPTFTGRINFGSGKVFTQFQAGVSYTTQGDPYFDYEPFQVSLGMGLRLGGKSVDTDE